MINWDAMVLAPSMQVFAEPLVVTPLATQPTVLPYAGRGVFKVDNIDVQLEQGIMSSQIITIGVRVSEYAVPPQPGDQVTIRNLNYLIDDTDEDGQGGSIWTMKQMLEAFVP